MRAPSETKKRAKRRRKELPPLPDTARPQWLPDDRFLHDACTNAKREQRRLDAQRIAERVAEIAGWMRQMQYPRAAEQAWQIVAVERGCVSTGDPFEVAAEGKHLARWVRRNR